MQNWVRSLGVPLLAVAVVFAVESVRAAELPSWSTGSEPIQIDAQSLEARADDGVVVFQGEVVARQGDLTLQADRVAVYADQGTGELLTAEAQGNVRIQRGEIVATGQEASYDVAVGEMTLSGDAKAWRGRNVVAGDRIILHLAEDRVVVEGAKAVLFPGDQQLQQ